MRYHAQSARLNRRCLTLRNQPSSRAFLLAVIRYSLDDVTHFIRSTRTDIAREDYASRTIFERNRRTKFEPGFVQTASDRLVERFLQHHLYCGLPKSPKILGGSPGGVGFVAGGSGSFVSGGRKTISRCFFTRPLPFSFSANGFQQSAQMSNSFPSICRGEHSFASPQRSQTIMAILLRLHHTPVESIPTISCKLLSTGIVAAVSIKTSEFSLIGLVQSWKRGPEKVTEMILEPGFMSSDHNGEKQKGHASKPQSSLYSARSFIVRLNDFL
jgi:hypothetical protein